VSFLREMNWAGSPGWLAAQLNIPIQRWSLSKGDHRKGERCSTILLVRAIMSSILRTS